MCYPSDELVRLSDVVTDSAKEDEIYNTVNEETGSEHTISSKDIESLLEQKLLLVEHIRSDGFFVHMKTDAYIHPDSRLVFKVNDSLTYAGDMLYRKASEDGISMGLFEDMNLNPKKDLVDEKLKAYFSRE